MARDEAHYGKGHDDGLTALTALDPAWLLGRTAIDGRATAYICRGTTCSLPITDPNFQEGA